MMGPLLPILVLVLIGVALWTGRMSAGSGTTSVAAPTAPPRDLAERDAFIEQLRELAWQHRDVSPR